MQSKIKLLEDAIRLYKAGKLDARTFDNLIEVIAKDKVEA